MFMYFKIITMQKFPYGWIALQATSLYTFKVLPVNNFVSLVSLLVTVLDNLAKAELVGANKVRPSPEII